MPMRIIISEHELVDLLNGHLRFPDGFVAISASRECDERGEYGSEISIQLRTAEEIEESITQSKRDSVGRD